MMVDSKEVFIDTNILVFSNVSLSPYNSRAKAKLIELVDNDYKLYVSNQVIREYIAVLSKPNTNGKRIADSSLINDVNRIRNEFNVIYENNQTLDYLQMLLAHCPTGGKQIHDANIVSTMLAYSIELLLTHNIDDFKRFNKFIKIMSI